jgi:hypothetical protein
MADLSSLKPEELRWLHDKYERLSNEEDSLASSRTSYFAAIGTVIVTGLIVTIADLLSQHFLLAVMVTFLGAIGIIISVVWWLLLRRTADAQYLWREAALRLEDLTPPLKQKLVGSINLGKGGPVIMDLSKPYHVHLKRFSGMDHLSETDRVNPTMLTEVLPVTFLVIWVVALAAVWTWYCFIL